MDINAGSLWKVAKAAVLPVPTAVEAAIEHVAAPPPPPPPPPPQLEPKLPANTVLPPPNADAAAARAAANGIWRGKSSTVADEQRTVDADSPTILAPKANADAAKLDEQALTQVYANRKLQADALAKLSPEQREQYKQLENFFENDPQAHLALQMNLIEGKLTAGPKNQDGKDLLGALDALRTQKVQPPLNNGMLLAEAVREIAQPSTIKQHNKNTCSVASLQIMMANERPAEYVRILAGLSAEGNPGVKLANGETVKRLDGMERHDGSGRTMTSQIWQSTMMQLAAQKVDPGAKYDNATDTVTWTNGPPTTGGMFGKGAAGAASAVTGQTYDVLDGTDTAFSYSQGLQQSFANNPNQKVAVTLGANYGPDGTPQNMRQAEVVGFSNGMFKVKEGNQTVDMTPDELENRLQKAPGYDREAETDKAFDKLKAATAKGEHPIAMIRLGAFDNMDGQTRKDKDDIGGPANEMHYIHVTKIENGQVTYLNSHGTEEHMSEAAFKNKLANAVSKA